MYNGEITHNNVRETEKVKKKILKVDYGKPC